MSQENENQVEVEELEAEQLPDEASDEDLDAVAEEKKPKWPIAIIGIVVALLVACSGIVCAAAAVALIAGGGSDSVTGEVTYRERMALTPDAVVIVQIQDVSRADAPADVIGEQVIKNPGQVPIPFDVSYNKKKIDDRHTYVVAARIEDGSGNLLFTSTQSHPVITQGNPTENVQVMVYLAGIPPQKPPSGKAYIKIEDPTQGAIVDISKPVMVRGSGAGLPEGNVVVQAIDRDGNVLAEKPTTLQGQDVGSGGAGTWEVELGIKTEPGTAGTFYAYSLSPLDNSMVASDEIQVSLGQTKAKKAYIKIQEPAQGATVDISKPVMVKGMGGALPEGNVVVQVLDRNGSVLAEKPTTVQAPDAGTGGEGPWSVELAVNTEPGMAGKIYAFARSPLDNSLIAKDSVEVSLGKTEAVPTFLEIQEPREGAVLDTSSPIQVSGVGGGLPEGNVVVRALDANDKVLAEQATILQGSDPSTGGAGTWSVQLIVGAIPGTAGQIVAFSPSPTDGGYVASAVANVSYGSAEGGGELEGTQWLLGQTLPGTEITALFQNGQVSGSSGCNTFQGGYTTSTSLGRSTIQIGPLASTMMMCPEEDVMDQETAFLTAFQSATTYQVEENLLTLKHPGGRLVFEGQASR